MPDGATHSEHILECARRNNTELFSEICESLEGNDSTLCSLINSTSEIVTQNGPLHIATMLGNWEVLDLLLDIPGVEIDPRNREHATPLHLAVKYASEEPELGYFIADNLLDAGSDPRLVDIHGLKPLSYVKENQKLLELLNNAEYAAKAEDIVVEKKDDKADEDDVESASDSD